MDKIVSAFADVYEQRDVIVSALKQRDVSFLRFAHDAIPWAQGIEDDQLSLQSKSEVCTAMEKLRDETSPSIAPPNVDRNGETSKLQELQTDECVATSAREGDDVARDPREATDNVTFMHERSDPGKIETSKPRSCQRNTRRDHVVEDGPSDSASLDDGAVMQQLDKIVAQLNDSSEDLQFPLKPEYATPSMKDTSGKEEKNSTSEAKKRKIRKGHNAPMSTAEGCTSSSMDNDLCASRTRRIPTRLLPWECTLCTFHNKGADFSCQMCGIARAAVGSPAAVAATAAAQLQAVRDSSETVKTASKTMGAAKGAGGGRSRKRRSGSPLALQSKLTATKAQRGRRQCLGKVALEDKPQKAPHGESLNRSNIVDENKCSNKEANASRSDLKEQGNWDDGKKSWVLLGSGLDPEHKTSLQILADISGSSLAESWCPEVTHVVCGGVEADGGRRTKIRTARRTFKYMMGILHGCWVVSGDWVEACLSARTKVAEEDYEIQQDALGSAGGPAKARKLVALQNVPRRQPKGKHVSRTSAKGHSLRTAVPGAYLLKGFEVYLHGVFSGKNREHLLQVLSSAGAKVLKRMPVQGVVRDEDCSKERGGIILVELPDSNPNETARFKANIASETWFAHAKGANVPIVSHKWVSDSISRFEALPLSEYMACA